MLSVIFKAITKLKPAGSAAVGDVIAGKTFYNTSAKEVRTGTRPNSGYGANAKSNTHQAASSELTCAEGAIAYAIVCVKDNSSSSGYPPEFTLQGWNGSEWETVSLSRVSGGACTVGSGGGSLYAWYWTGTFPKRYTKVKYSWPQNSVYARYTQIFLFK